MKRRRGRLGRGRVRLPSYEGSGALSLAAVRTRRALAFHVTRDVAEARLFRGSGRVARLVSEIVPRPTPVLFYGWSVGTIAEWCRVSCATARRYKTGALSPSPQARALFVLHRDGRVLAAAEWERWQVRGDVLIDPEGNETSARLVRGYMLMLQWVRSKYVSADEYWCDMDRAFGSVAPGGRAQR